MNIESPDILQLRNPLLERNPGTISTNIIPSTSVDNHALPSLVVTQTTPVDDDVGFGDDLIVLETFGAEEDHSSLPIEDNRGKNAFSISKFTDIN